MNIVFSTERHSCTCCKEIRLGAYFYHSQKPSPYMFLCKRCTRALKQSLNNIGFSSDIRPIDKLKDGKYDL